MADIIRLRGSPHEQTQLLLPWRNNDTLTDEEAALVEAHLAECAECRADAEADQALARAVASASMDVEHGWAALNTKLDEQPAAEPVSLLRRRVPVGWMLAGQAAAIAFAVFLAVPSPSPDPDYRALSAPAANVQGNVVIVFQPEANERDIRAVLLESDAQVTDGPNKSGAYVLRVSPASRQRALENLRSSPKVMLAEAIDPASER